VALPQIDSTLVVVAAGVDPGGGAGLLRDVATVRALGARAHAVGTAWTEQGDGVHRVEPRAPEAVRAALAEALATLRPAAVKIGMAVGPATAAALVEALDGYTGPIVVDPVLATSRGGSLWSGAPRELFPLLRRATLVTPNAVEAGTLAGRSATTVAEAEAAARQLVELDALRAVLVKGGHLVVTDGAVVDLLVTASATERLSHPRIPGPSPRGTGCALATAIAVELGRGRPLDLAIRTAVDWLGRAITAAEMINGERHLL
jgi:hydroxymethylpyrimidine/phosphomethylpyrimidine kinase